MDNGKMLAMVFEEKGKPLKPKNIPIPTPSENQVLIKVHVCGICRTDLHIFDGELNSPKLPLIPGHEIIGTIIKIGKNVESLKEGDRIGVPWLAYTCGKCKYCLRGQENLCEKPLFTGYTMNGGYSEYTVAYENYCFRIPENYDNNHAAPLLCAGLIGYRSYRMAGKHLKKVGIYGFGAAAHILIQIANYEGNEVYAFTKEGDIQTQKFAKSLGAVWAGDSSANLVEKLEAAIIFAPVGSLVPLALKNICKGGTVVCGGIHMTDIPSFPYSLLWGERSIRSVANLTRADGEDFFSIASQFQIKTEVTTFPLIDANKAIQSLRKGNINGAVTLSIS